MRLDRACRVLRRTNSTCKVRSCPLQEFLSHTFSVSKHRRLVPLYGKKSNIGADTFVAPDATIVGSANIGKNSLVWFAQFHFPSPLTYRYGAVIRADVDPVSIGNNTAIGERALIHIPVGINSKGVPVSIGDNVNVGAGVLIVGSTIKDGATIEAGAVLTAGSVVGERSVVKAGSHVVSGTKIPAEEIWGGSPAVFVKKLTEEDIKENEKKHDHHMRNGELYASFDHSCRFSSADTIIGTLSRQHKNTFSISKENLLPLKKSGQTRSFKSIQPFLLLTYF